MPKVDSSDASRFRALGREAKGPLLKALSDEKRYVTAHVLLTEIFGAHFEPDSSTWNGLHVTLQPDGEVMYIPSDASILRDRWDEYFRGQ